MSIEFDSYDEVSTDDEHLFSTPLGTVCEGWKEAKIPMNNTETFSAVVQFVDEKKLQSESLLHYSSAEQLVIVGGARQNDMMPFTNEKGVPAEATSVVHDFNKGYEYALDSSRCVRLSALPNNTADVLSSAEGALTLGPIMNMLIASDLMFGNYGQVLNSDGRMLDVYRAIDKKTNDTVEAYFYGAQLENYATYKLVNGVPTLSSHAQFTHSPADVVPTLVERIRSCFTQTASAPSENNTFTFEVKSSMSQFSKFDWAVHYKPLYRNYKRCVWPGS
ncbi:hypothetical protein OESDEN_12171 [Oesophagostomum dentatum]|uniref:LolA-like domain-containing protein n=1 Tax=Oesophagostomum dentatum TaxID=61180 RepID=A0A0B1SVW6_OESDE|nr:hypothetical protein OESDEN_12171 [Oesophagostomum dentatum]